MSTWIVSLWFIFSEYKIWILGLLNFSSHILENGRHQLKKSSIAISAQLKLLLKSVFILNDQFLSFNFNFPLFMSSIIKTWNLIIAVVSKTKWLVSKILFFKEIL